MRPSLQRATYRVWLAVGVLALLWAAFHVLGKPLAVVVPPLLVAVIVVHLLNPIVAGLARRGVPRWAGTVVAYLGAGLGVAVVVRILVPVLGAQLDSFTEMAPELVSGLMEDVEALAQRAGITLPVMTTLDGESLAEGVEGVFSSEGSVSAVVAVLGGLSGIATGIVHVLLVSLLGPIIALYLLVELPRLGAWAREIVPPDYRDEAATVGDRLGKVVGGYIRGQLLVALFVGTATSLGLLAIGLPFWALIGVIAGLTNLIPLVGPFVAGFVGVTVALMSGGPGLALLVVVVVTAVQQVDNHVVSPLVMGRNVRLHPLVVLFALLVAGTLYGIFGLFVAVPAVAAVNVLVSHLWRSRVPWAREDDLAPRRSDEGKEPQDRMRAPPDEPDASRGESDVSRRESNRSRDRAGGREGAQSPPEGARPGDMARPENIRPGDTTRPEETRPGDMVLPSTSDV